jgi:hypothetical protein
MHNKFPQTGSGWFQNSRSVAYVSSIQIQNPDSVPRTTTPQPGNPSKSFKILLENPGTRFPRSSNRLRACGGNKSSCPTRPDFCSVIMSHMRHYSGTFCGVTPESSRVRATRKFNPRKRRGALVISSFLRPSALTRGNANRRRNGQGQAPADRLFHAISAPPRLGSEQIRPSLRVSAPNRRNLTVSEFQLNEWHPVQLSLMKRLHRYL